MLSVTFDKESRFVYAVFWNMHVSLRTFFFEHHSVLARSRHQPTSAVLDLVNKKCPPPRHPWDFRQRYSWGLPVMDSKTKNNIQSKIDFNLEGTAIHHKYDGFFFRLLEKPSGSILAEWDITLFPVTEYVQTKDWDYSFSRISLKERGLRLII